MINAQIVDGGGDGHVLKVNEEGALGVVLHTHPPIEERLNTLPFRQYLTVDGLASGSNNMLVDGSVTPVEFCVKASADYDIYIKSVAVVIADASATLSKFGNIAALTNGVKFEWISSDNGTIVIHEGLKSNFSFVRIALGTPSFGDGAGAFRAGNIVGTSEGYIPVIDFEKTFGLQWGVRLRKGSNDKLCFTVRDNVTAIDGFNAVAYGIKF